ncbi:hypothetical protein ACXYMX_00290 [Sporosarcina sp. CAU 1771]
MKKFYFTFGSGHPKHNTYQVIFAKTEEVAYKKMFAIHGTQWAFCYNQEQWTDSRKKYFRNLKPLKYAYEFAS